MALEKIVWNVQLRRFRNNQGDDTPNIEPVGNPVIIVPNNSGGDLDLAVNRSAPETANAYCLGETKYFGQEAMAVQYYRICSLSPPRRIFSLE